MYEHAGECKPAFSLINHGSCRSTCFSYRMTCCLGNRGQHNKKNDSEFKWTETVWATTICYSYFLHPDTNQLFGKRNVKTCILVTGAGHKGIIPTNRSFFFYAFGWVSNPGVAAVSPAWSLRSSDTLISWNWDMAVIPHPACCPNCCSVHLDNGEGFSTCVHLFTFNSPSLLWFCASWATYWRRPWRPGRWPARRWSGGTGQDHLAPSARWAGPRCWWA